MIRIFLLFLFGLGLFLEPADLWAQNGKDKEFKIDVAFGDLFNQLELNNDQKVATGVALFKHTLSFDYGKFNGASEIKQYQMINAKINDLEVDLKGILDKQQFKKYKKWKRKTMKELKKGRSS